MGGLEQRGRAHSGDTEGQHLVLKAKRSDIVRVENTACPVQPEQSPLRGKRESSLFHLGVGVSEC